MQLTRHSDLAIQRTRRRPTRMEVDFHGLRDWRPATAGAGFIGARPPVADRLWCDNSTWHAATTSACFSICFSPPRRRRRSPRARQRKSKSPCRWPPRWSGTFVAWVAAACWSSWREKRRFGSMVGRRPAWPGRQSLDWRLPGAEHRRAAGGFHRSLCCRSAGLHPAAGGHAGHRIGSTFDRSQSAAEPGDKLACQSPDGWHGGDGALLYATVSRPGG